MPNANAGPAETNRAAGRSLADVSLDVVTTGIAIIVPFVVTIDVPSMAHGLVTDALVPFIALLQWAGIIQVVERVAVLADLGVYRCVVDVLTEFVALVVLVVVGSIGHHRFGERSSVTWTSPSRRSRASGPSPRASGGCAT